MIELRSFGPWMKYNTNIVLLCFFKLPIMLEIILCYNRDIIPTWCVGKSISQLTHCEKNYIYACYRWYEFCMNGHVNHSISRPTLFVETSNEKLKWNTDVNVQRCVWIYIWGIHFIWMSCCEITWGQDNKSTDCVTCCSTLLYELMILARLE
jgi:hypothetical protein